ncbi:MAG: hypothetical protein AAGK04_03615 [Planctomycetota bacterium]
MADWRRGPALTNVRVVKAIDAKHANLAELLSTSDVRWTALVEQPRGDVWLADARSAGRWIIKSERSIGSKGRWRSAFGRGPRAKAYRWGQALSTSSLVAVPAALLAAREADGPRVEATITPELRGPTLLEALTHEDIDIARHAAEYAGNHAQRLLAQNVWNRDHKPSNLAFDGAVERDRLRLVDLDGLRPLAGREHRAVLRMLVSMVIETLGVGRPLEPTVRWRLDHAFYNAAGPKGWELLDDEINSIERLTSRVDQLVAGHGDPTPKRDPFEAERRRAAISGAFGDDADPGHTL